MPVFTTGLTAESYWWHDTRGRVEPPRRFASHYHNMRGNCTQRTHRVLGGGLNASKY
jgi:hypothetical protein